MAIVLNIDILIFIMLSVTANFWLLTGFLFFFHDFIHFLLFTYLSALANEIRKNISLSLTENHKFKKMIPVF